MSKVMPSQVVQTIDQLFPHAKLGGRDALIEVSSSPKLKAILALIDEIPEELIDLPAPQYAILVLAKSTIEFNLDIWTTRGSGGGMPPVNGTDVVAAIRQSLSQCSDEHPPPQTAELLFVSDAALRDSIRRDVGAAYRALANSEWKAATVLAGATIEALLHWKIHSWPKMAEIEQALSEVIKNKLANDPKSKDIDRWGLEHFIEVSANMNFIQSDTKIAVGLARNFRNLIHPGRAARLQQTCDRATAYSAIGALEHVIRDLS
jgi:hypothetical protein